MILLTMIFMLTFNAFGQNAKVQIIHNAADPDARYVDIYLDNTLILDNFAFRDATAYLDVVSGDHTIHVADSSSSSVSDAIADFNVSLTADENYTVVANGVLAPDDYEPNPDGSIDISFNLFADGNAMLTGASGKISVRVFHGTTDAPAVTVHQGGSVIINSLAYGGFTDYLDLDPQSYILNVLPANDPNTIVGSFSVDLTPFTGESITLLASGFMDTDNNGPAGSLVPPFTLIAVFADGTVVDLGASRAQIIHNAADPAAQMVDIYIDGTLAVDDFEFRKATPYIDIDSGVREVAVAPSNSTSVNDAIATIPMMVNIHQTYVIIANGVITTSNFAANPDGENIGFQLLAKADARESADDNAKVEFFVVHGVTDAPTVDVAVQGGPTLVNDAAYGDITDYIAVDPDSYVLDVTTADGATVVASFDADVSALAGGSAVILASGFLNAASNQNGDEFGLLVALADGTTLMLPKSSGTPIEKTGMTLPSQFELKGNYPNPFNPSTNIQFDLPFNATMTVDVFNTLGQKVMTIQPGTFSAGTNQQLSLNAVDLNSGIYIYRLTAQSNNQTITRFGKMMLLK